MAPTDSPPLDYSATVPQLQQEDHQYNVDYLYHDLSSPPIYLACSLPIQKIQIGTRGRWLRPGSYIDPLP